MGDDNLNNHTIQKYADMLYEAERDRVPVPPLTEQYPALTVSDAYTIQLENINRVTAMGQVISGKKIGLTSPGIQQQLGVNEPDYGHLFASMNCADGLVDTNQLIQPKIEAELAFVLASNLSGGKVTVQDVLAATEYVVGAFEIVDSRVAEWKIRLADTVADNASSGRYILGEKRYRASDTDLSAETMNLYKNGTLAGQGSGSAVLGNPCAAVAWLANRLWDFGIPLKGGEVILSGAFSAAPTAQKGDVFKVEFSSFGSIEARFI